MSYEVRPGSIFGRLGQGVGQGLAEQVPKEIERYRLSSGLKDIAKRAPNLSPFELMAEAYGLPGINPEIVRQIGSYARNQALARGAPESEKVPQRKIQQVGATPSLTESTQSKETPSFTTPKGSESVRKPIPVVSPKAIDSLARQKMANDPQLFNDESGYDRAYKMASDELNLPAAQQQEDINAYNRTIAQESNIGNKFLNKVQTKTQKTPESGLFNLIPGEVLNRFQKKAEAQVLAGDSDEQATEDQSNNVLEMSKKLNTLRNNIGARPFFGKADPQLAKDVKNLRPFFEKHAELELFKDEQKLALDIGDHLASLQTWDPSDPLKDAIVNISKNDEPAKIAAKIYDKIGPEDSIFTLGYLLNKIGVDDAAVINELNQLKADNVFKPKVSRQERELSEYYALNPDLSDLYWQTLLGPAGMGIISGIKWLTGNKPKVGPIQKIKQRLGKE